MTDNYFLGGVHVDRWASVTQSGNTVLNASSLPTTTKVVVRPNQYEAGRANIAVYNWGRQGAVSVDLSRVLKVGDTYEVRNAESFYDAPVASGVYGGGSVSLPLGTLPVARVINGSAKPAPTTPNFNVFVVLKTN